MAESVVEATEHLLQLARSDAGASAAASRRSSTADGGAAAADRRQVGRRRAASGGRASCARARELADAAELFAHESKKLEKAQRPPHVRESRACATRFAAERKAAVEAEAKWAATSSPVKLEAATTEAVAAAEKEEVLVEVSDPLPVTPAIDLVCRRRSSRWPRRRRRRRHSCSSRRSPPAEEVIAEPRRRVAAAVLDAARAAWFHPTTRRRPLRPRRRRRSRRFEPQIEKYDAAAHPTRTLIRWASPTLCLERRHPYGRRSSLLRPRRRRRTRMR